MCFHEHDEAERTEGDKKGHFFLFFPNTRNFFPMPAPYFDIPTHKNWVFIRQIKAGWSDDLKYEIHDKAGEKYLLRLSEEKSLLQELEFYAALKQLNDVDIPIPKLIGEGICNEGRNTFRLFTWMEGEVFEGRMDKFSSKELYQFGLDAGRLLKAIHQVSSPRSANDWEAHYNKKIDRKIAAYKNCGITFDHSDELLAFIEAHRYLLKDRPQCFQHGDYHVGNMLITPDHKLAAIDFNRLDFGDPIEEFNRLVWSAEKSPHFASGQIDGYFEAKVPADFFKRLALFIAVNQLGSIPWAIPYGQKELEVLLNQTNRVMAWYDNFKKEIPSWYKKGS